MSFSIDAYTLPPLRCYSDAKIYWEQTKPWRGDADTNTRPLAGRKRNQTIRKLNDGSFACRLHGTDVVTYHPNGDITLQAYPSVSTDAFARRLTPDGVTTSFNDAAGYVVVMSQDAEHTGFRMYRMETTLNRLTIRRNDRGGWLPVDANATIPFNKYKLDIPIKNAVFKECGVPDFTLWLKARETLGAPVRGYYWQYNADHHDILQRLMRVEDWEGIYQEFGCKSLEAVKNAVIKIKGCLTVEQFNYLDTWNEVKSVVVSSRKYANLVKGI